MLGGEYVIAAHRYFKVGVHHVGRSCRQVVATRNFLTILTLFEENEPKAFVV